MRLKLLACEIFYRELCAVVAQSVNQVDVEFLPKGLHDIGQASMSARLGEAVAAVDESRYDAILLGYGLCNNGIVGLSARQKPLVVPRAHDCITLFLGSKERYLEYFFSHPGVYFKTSGWIERGDGLALLGHEKGGEKGTGSEPARGGMGKVVGGEAPVPLSSPDSIARQSGMLQTYEELAAKYGEDNAKFLYDELCNMTRNYGGLTYIATGIEPDDRFEQHTRHEAAQRGWKFERLDGTLALAQALVDGPWDSNRFLVVPPGATIAASFDDGVVKANL